MKQTYTIGELAELAGVSIKTIAWLMKENKGSIYQRRLRLRSEIESSDFLHKELYLRLLGK